LNNTIGSNLTPSGSGTSDQRRSSSPNLSVEYSAVRMVSFVKFGQRSRFQQFGKVTRHYIVYKFSSYSGWIPAPAFRKKPNSCQNASNRVSAFIPPHTVHKRQIYYSIFSRYNIQRGNTNNLIGCEPNPLQ